MSRRMFFTFPHYFFILYYFPWPNDTGSTEARQRAPAVPQTAPQPAPEMSKALRGIEPTDELRSIRDRSLALLLAEADGPSPAPAPGSGGGAAAGALAALPPEEAADILRATEADPDSGSPWPLRAVRAMRGAIRGADPALLRPAEREALLGRLGRALRRRQAEGGGSALVFAAPAPEEDGEPPGEDGGERARHKRRIERLRLRQEERRYRTLTGNLDTAKPDDLNIRSMQYAASVGMNMIVAPVSFGAFMFFFSGHLFGWILGGDGGASSPGGVDIRAVISGVISGVAMLFIEMTLFVIRSHEMDASLRKKARRAGPNPFGYSKETAARTFEG